MNAGAPRPTSSNCWTTRCSPVGPGCGSSTRSRSRSRHWSRARSPTAARPARRERLLEPFVRRDGAPAARTGGAGLGLAVVRHLVESHEGTLAIDDGPFGGARVVVRLPLFEAE